MVSSASHVSNESDFTTSSQDEFNATSINNITLHNPDVDDHESESRILLNYVVLPLSTLVTLIIFVGVTAFLIRKRRLDKLRHHLMPLYSFDPAEEGEDWEAELLEEGTDHQPKGKGTKQSEQPQLSFRSNL